MFSLIIIQIDAYASGKTGGSPNPDATWRSMQRPVHPVDITVTTHQAIHIDQNHSPTYIMGDMTKDSKHLANDRGILK